jgi:hypothetical protein
VVRLLGLQGPAEQKPTKAKLTSAILDCMLKGACKHNYSVGVKKRLNKPAPLEKKQTGGFTTVSIHGTWGHHFTRPTQLYKLFSAWRSIAVPCSSFGDSGISLLLTIDSLGRAVPMQEQVWTPNTSLSSSIVHTQHQSSLGICSTSDLFLP